MAKKHRILFHSDPLWVKTGLAESAKTLMKYLASTGKYELAYFNQQGTPTTDPRNNLMPWPSFGCIPNDPALIQRLNQDGNMARNASYGSIMIDQVIQEFKPTIYIGSNDIWSFSLSDFCQKPWWSKIHSMLHITVDSLPVLDQAFEQAKLTKHYFTWAKFAANAMKKVGKDFEHVSQIYGAMDIQKFSPIADNVRNELRKRFGIADTTIIFLFVGRNQLRKQFVQCLEAFGKFKRENPNADAKLLFHTSFGEQGAGWNLPKMAAFHGVKPEDMLATYVCKKCGRWHVKSYCGEDIDCPYCNEKKSCITANIIHGVSDEEMKLLYGISDAGLCLLSSGGQELTACQTLLCGKPLACTNYSSGEDFCVKPFIYKLGFHPYYEAGTSFLKATTDVDDIRKYMRKMCFSSKKELEEIGRIGREWAIETFGIASIGKQWENIFDSLPINDWQEIKSTQERKNDSYPMPSSELNDGDFITTLYKNVLNMNETPSSEGHKHWAEKLKNGMKREDIYNYFISVARDENKKIQAPTDFWTLIDKDKPEKRAIFIARESIGDIILFTQLFESFHKKNPNYHLYVATKPQYNDLLAGNPFVHKVIPYADFMENEMILCGAGQSDQFFHKYYNPGILTQRQLNYLNL